ncbi:MAG: 3-isopropylmalate dehydratase large subunit [Rhodospirillaceae bacterium]|nr:3-isopropylmalate dehydratase large subunit [Rhodospirillaceae bacterium]
MSGTLFDKIWDAHVVASRADGTDLVHIDRHVLHDLGSNVAFDKLHAAGRKVHSPELTIAVHDHIVSSAPGRRDDSFAAGAPFAAALRENTARHGIRLFGLDDPQQGIVHVVAPETGAALPGITLACGDSHTCTVGGIGALAIGIGTSEVEHILATQTLILRRPRTLRVRFDGVLGRGVSAKDMILYLIGRIGIKGGVGFAVEYAGSAVAALPVEARLTLCNMSIELGARIGMVAPDEATFAWLDGRRFAPKGAAWDRALAQWRGLASGPDAVFDHEVAIDAAAIAPQVSWGTTPAQVLPIEGRIPDPASIGDAAARAGAEQALAYMGLVPGTPLEGIPIDKAFIGSCTNSRLSDLRAAAAAIRGRKVAAGVRALVVPGSTAVKREAEAEGLDRVFRDAGFEWRESACSMCAGVNDDRVGDGERCISSSNRNFEGRQGPGARTHLASPAMVAAAAVTGRITDVRKLGA